MRLFSSILPAVVALCASLDLCRAQERPVSLQFITFPKSMEPLKIELSLGEGKTKELEILSTEISPVVQVPAMPSWVFGTTEKNEAGKSVFRVLGQAKALASSQQFIMLIRKGAELSSGYEVRVMENDKQTLGAGKFLFMNASSVDIAGNTGGVKFVLKPSEMTIVEPKPEDNGSLFHAMFYFRRDNEPRPFFSSKWPLSENTRGFVFFYHDPDTKQLRLHTIRHFME